MQIVVYDTQLPMIWYKICETVCFKFKLDCADTIKH